MRKIKAAFLVLVVVSAVVIIYLGMQSPGWKFTGVLQNLYSTNSILHIGTVQTNETKWGDRDGFHSKHWRRESINKNCTKEYKNSHYLLIDILPAKTGNNLFQLHCGLVTALRMCYTAVIEPNNNRYRKGILPYFDLSDDFKIMEVNNRSFHPFKGSLVPVLGNKIFLSNIGYNRTIKDRCWTYRHTVGYEEFIRSSIRFKEDINRKVSEYLEHFFAGRSVVVIHVRRQEMVGKFKEKGYEYANLKWYKPYIKRAMDLLQSTYNNLSFIFVSDDKTWCKENFQGENIHISPFKSLGEDLALMTRSDHVILTIGTFGWHGAWLGRRKTVIYDSKCIWGQTIKRQLYLPEWTDIGWNNTKCLL